MRKAFVSFAVLSAVVFVYVACTAFDSPEKDRFILELVRDILKRYHYRPLALDNDFSKKVHEAYLDDIDGQKHFFTQGDMEDFDRYKLRLDDEIKYESFKFFDLTYGRLQQRLKDVKTMYTEILGQGFDYTRKDFWNIDRESKVYAIDEDALYLRWKKHLKYRIMRELLAEFGDQKITDSLLHSSDTLQTRLRRDFLKNFNSWHGKLERKPRNYWIGEYIDAIAMTFDPHTNYLPPTEKNEFDIRMSGQLEGIGARLVQKLGVIGVVSLVPGGPAWLDGQLSAGDKILKVGQGKDSAMVNIVDMDMQDVLDRIRGKKGTLVRLEIKKSDGRMELIELVRDVIELEETFARSAVITYQGRKYGYIFLPKFYINFKDKDRRDCAKDVRVEIEKLKHSGISGLVLDLRLNGGGSLKSCVEIAGMFIEDGPVVQVRSGQGKVRTLSDEDGGETLYDGGLVVMVSKYSASASEILAAALQDYDRAIIMGGNKTFGKGTVQGLWDLDPLLTDRYEEFKPLGTLKLTTQKFYRISGKTTQIQGVASDIVLPDSYTYGKVGEEEEKNALPWDNIDSLEYTKWKGSAALKRAIAQSRKNIVNTPYFSEVARKSKWVNQYGNDTLVSLQIQTYKKAQDDYLSQLRKFDLSDSTWNKSMRISMSVADNKVAQIDSVFRDRYEGWFEEVEGDAYTQEAVKVLSLIKP